MKFYPCTLLQDDKVALVYTYNRELKGYMIAGLYIHDTVAAKLRFAKVWKYFVTEIVRNDDIYCSIPISEEHSMFRGYLEFYDKIEDMDIYKVDNYLKHQYSDYLTHVENTTNGQ